MLGSSAACLMTPMSSSRGAYTSCRRCTAEQQGSPILIRQRSSLQQTLRQPVCPLQKQRRNGLCAATSRPVTPDMPFPGDDQGSTIYSALSGLESAAEDLIAKAEDATSKAMGSTPTASVTDGQNGTSPGGPEKKGSLPHRWVIVGAMALAFVLCNMDKVCLFLLPCIFVRCWVHASHRWYAFGAQHDSKSVSQHCCTLCPRQS